MQGADVHNMLFQAGRCLPGQYHGVKNIIIYYVSLIDRDEVLDAAIKLSPGSGFSVTPDLPPSLNYLRSKLLKQRWEMPPDERKKHKLVYIKEEPFVVLKEKKNK